MTATWYSVEGKEGKTKKRVERKKRAREEGVGGRRYRESKSNTEVISEVFRQIFLQSGRNSENPLRSLFRNFECEVV